MVRVLQPTPDAVEEAARLLRQGRLVAFPTETVYGLGAVATSDRAVDAIYRAKGRPRHNPLILHVPDLTAVRVLAVVDGRALALAERFWPGPLTLVLPQAAGAPISRLATAGLGTVALRIPAHPVARTLLEQTMLPVAAPSANPSGLVSPTTARHVADDLGEALALVLDGGPCPIGVESTVVDLSERGLARILRPGGVPREALEAVLGPFAEPSPTGTSAPKAPGQLGSHYAPRLPLRLDATRVEADEALLAFGPNPPAGALVTLSLSPTGDLAEAARSLFAMLRAADRSGAARIAVAPIPEGGLGDAIRDRLRRAAGTGSVGR